MLDKSSYPIFCLYLGFLLLTIEYLHRKFKKINLKVIQQVEI